MSSTKEVLDRHLRSFGEQDLKGILSDYAPDAVFFTPEGPLKGDRIKLFFQALLAEFGKPGAAFSLKHQSVEGDYGYILWTAETADNVYGLGTDTFIVAGWQDRGSVVRGQDHAQAVNARFRSMAQLTSP